MHTGVGEFERNLAVGRIAESKIARWLRRVCKCTVLPAYEIEISRGKGPRLFTPQEEFVSPDFLTFRRGYARWVEAKHKTVFTWHRNSSQWTTGIDLRHYLEYQKVAAALGFPVWLLFLHVCSIPNALDVAYCPPECPTGLFAAELAYLKEHESHRSEKHRMVYWAHKSLKLIATLDEMD